MRVFPIDLRLFQFAFSSEHAATPAYGSRSRDEDEARRVGVRSRHELGKSKGKVGDCFIRNQRANRVPNKFTPSGRPDETEKSGLWVKFPDFFVDGGTGDEGDKPSNSKRGHLSISKYGRITR